ncbi:MAG TPA: glycosyltransferase family 1 protein [Saliniramus sp.]|nr:glycosyltransferase family 1 protein [Saliniramus sp.]
MIATDAWYPQINGVVRSIEEMAAHAAEFGFDTQLVTPLDFRTVPFPGYDEIRLALARPAKLARLIATAAPTHIHIATEGPIGFMTRRFCMARGIPFTTSYHTRFPEYLASRVPVPTRLSYALLRRFHASAQSVMVGTHSLEQELTGREFERIVRWKKGVDCRLFRPRATRVLDVEGPVFLTVARLAVEKNIAAFLALDLPGTKVVVGDGPARRELEAIDPSARFMGVVTGERLAQIYASADVFVFPSLTDTFGIVMLEALASGLPIAAYPAPGPLDVIGDSGCGILDPDLGAAARAALQIDPARCRAHAERFSWRESAREFFGHVVEAGSVADAVAARELAAAGALAG